MPGGGPVRRRPGPSARNRWYLAGIGPGLPLVLLPSRGQSGRPQCAWEICSVPPGRMRACLAQAQSCLDDNRLGTKVCAPRPVPCGGLGRVLSRPQSRAGFPMTRRNAVDRRAFFFSCVIVGSAPFGPDSHRCASGAPPRVCLGRTEPIMMATGKKFDRL